MCLAQGPQRSDAGEARTRYPSVSSQALYHWATALPHMYFESVYMQYIYPCEQKHEQRNKIALDVLVVLVAFFSLTFPLISFFMFFDWIAFRINYKVLNEEWITTKLVVNWLNFTRNIKLKKNGYDTACWVTYARP